MKSIFKKSFLFTTIFLLNISLNLNSETKQKKSKFSFSKLFSSSKKNKSEAHKKKPVLKANTDEDIYKWLRTVSEVVSIVKEKAFRNVDFSDFIQEALKASVPHVDAHSAFFTPKSYKNATESTSGEFSGIGVSIISKSPEDDALVIIEVLPGGPAKKAGLKAGDKIVEVNGDKLRGLSTDEVITKLKGKIKTEVKLKIIRDKKPLEFKVKRGIVKDQTSVCYTFKDQNIYYISLKIFAENSFKQMSDLLQKANKAKAKGIILDLRRNPGGILDSAVDLASLFVPKGSLVVTTKDRNKKVVASYKTKKDPIFNNNTIIFILIDNFTASASEILAGCLKYYSDKSFENKKSKNIMAFLLGTSSFGKGSVQEVMPISNGCALKLTTMLYYLPNQKSIQACGIEPDFLIKPKITPSEEIKWIKELYGKEKSLKHYITEEEVNINNGESGNKAEDDKKSKKDKKDNKKNDKEKADEKTWEEKQIEAINKDVQIKAAVNMINLLTIEKKCEPKKVNTRKKATEFLNKNYLTDKEFIVTKVK